jgi:hypothetical protein
MDITYTAENCPDAKDPASFAEALKVTRAHAKWKKEPAVILAKMVKVERSGQVLLHPRIHRLPLGLTHGSVNDVQYYLNKGFVVIDYWMPSSPNDAPQLLQRGEVMVEHGWGAELKTHEGRKRYAEVKQLLDQSMRGNKAEVEQKAKIKTLEQKLADAEQKLAKGK